MLWSQRLPDDVSLFMDPNGLEPSTSCMRSRRSPNWAMDPNHYPNIIAQLIRASEDAMKFFCRKSVESD